MATEVEINITDVDIRKGKPWNPDECPINRAFRRKGLTVSVRSDFLKLTLKDKEWRADVPDRLMAFIKRYDRGWTVKPFSFTIEVPAKVLR